MRRVWVWVLALALSSAVGAEEASEMDVEIVKNLGFYEQLEVLETHEMYEVLEKEAGEGPETEEAKGEAPK
jgi:hypothetical protein